MIDQIAVDFYITKNGKCYFRSWFESIDYQTAARINERLKRLKYGNLGDYKNLGENLFELRFHFGSAYRIYFGKESSKLIILLCAGDKSTQNRDIKKAKLLWEEYKND